MTVVEKSALCPVRSIVQQVLRKSTKVAVPAKVRAKKKNLHSLSSFFIAESWKLMVEQGIRQKLLAIETMIPQEFSTLEGYLNYLNGRHACFGWAWMRARIEEQVEASLELTLPLLEKNFPTEWKAYLSALRKNGHYWFRQSIRHHLRLGYHTAVSVIVKFLGTAIYQKQGSFVPATTAYIHSTAEACKTFAAFDLELLLASDGILWDSAAATSFAEWKVEHDQLMLPNASSDQILRVLEERASHAEAILGCPALKAAIDSDTTVFGEMFYLIAEILNAFVYKSE